MFIHMLVCVPSDQRQFDCSTSAQPDEISRRKWIRLFEQQISLFNLWLGKENSTLTKRIFIHKGMLVVPAAAFNWIYCLLSSLPLLGYYHARLACWIVFVECVTTVRPTDGDDEQQSWWHHLFNVSTSTILKHLIDRDKLSIIVSWWMKFFWCSVMAKGERNLDQSDTVN